jgi:isoaspartyl peptidase/L-asparaginase-like protein (Ntn-hydrolase superfamily)
LSLQSDHVLFCADGALQFAKRHGIEEVPTDYLVTEKAKTRLANFPNFPPSLNVEFYEHKPE